MKTVGRYLLAFYIKDRIGTDMTGLERTGQVGQVRNDRKGQERIGKVGQDRTVRDRTG